MMKYSFLAVWVSCFVFLSLNAQSDRWQQRIKYQINVDMDVLSNRFSGEEKITYWNNSPDTLFRLFFHAYWNAFQPNSMMDVRSRELGKIILGYDKKGNEVYDWDSRVKDRISKLKPDEIGYQKITSVKIAGIEQLLKNHETILEVKLATPIPPHSKTSLNVFFEAQVPLQVRRSGRDNAEGIRYSMSQWYPKMAEYDYQGWNANPYVAREFYGVWGDYDVAINIDSSYMLAASGTLQNPDEIGFGYQNASSNKLNNLNNTLAKKTWKFSVQNVHDFVWAADPTYTMIKRQPKNGPLLYIIYKKVDSLETKWQKLADTVELAYPFMAKTFGAYPYKNYSFIQGGDGGMEYPMATLIKNADIGTALHEWMHSWFQGMLASNESLFPWMDEGFTSYAESRITAYLHGNKNFIYADDYRGYFDLVKSGREEPMSTHADHYGSNYAYLRAVYSKGSVFLSQLGYITGTETIDKILQAYYNEWRFKHPNANDFIKVAEKVSGMELQWYKEYWMNTTKTIDYALGDISFENGKTKLLLKRLGNMPMPIDVLVTYKDGTRELHYIPLNLMYGAKESEDKSIPFMVHEEWKWTHPTYELELSKKVSEIKELEIDPSYLMADINRVNNKIIIP